MDYQQIRTQSIVCPHCKFKNFPELVDPGLQGVPVHKKFVYRSKKVCSFCGYPLDKEDQKD